MSEMKKLEGDVFIIPNSLLGPKSVLTQTSKDILCKTNEFFGFDPESPLVQIWATGMDVDNWGSHRSPKEIGEEAEKEIRNISGKRAGYFLDYLPAALFEGKKEGDTVTFQIKDTSVSLTLRQKGYRYRRFGSFEETLSLLETRYKAE